MLVLLWVGMAFKRQGKEILCRAMVQQGGLTGQLPCLGSSFVVSLSLWGKGSRLTMHLNKVARDLSEFITQEITGSQVYNHLRKWRQKWAKVSKLKDLSGAL